MRSAAAEQGVAAEPRSKSLMSIEVPHAAPLNAGVRRGTQDRTAMNERLKVSFDKPEHNWLAIYLDAGNQHLELPFSYTPFDFLSELVNALLNFFDGLKAKANCSYNPERYEFIFEPGTDRAQIQVVMYPDHRTIEGSGEVIFDYEGGRSEICLAFWRAIRELQGRVSPAEYKQGLGRDFPGQEVELLTEMIKGKHQAGRV